MSGTKTVNGKVTLRAPGPADVPALARLGRESFSASFAHLYSPANLAGFLDEVHDEAAVARRIADPERVYALAEIDGQLAGYCQVVLRDSFDHAGTARRPVTLSQLYCAPGATGNGVGAVLMDWAMAEARAHGADEIRLSVWSENFGAQRFYARYGFTKVADIDFWVGDHRDDEFLLACPIGEASA
ncbi:GNAT family N-acetyltransferase [Novosphingobium tardum]|uniref:GNAT family N-acetyltransferase n=1 Tax=Novosphingobium tardum TaxID=1538021 RepID=A0ABV8RPM1_9SPHN